MGYIPSQPDPSLEAKYGSRPVKDRAPSMLFGIIIVVVLIGVLAVAVRFA